MKITRKEFKNTKVIKYFYLYLDVNGKEVEISLSYDIDKQIYLENWNFLQDYNLTNEEIDEIENYIKNLDISKVDSLI